jgi:hypothetical protein
MRIKVLRTDGLLMVREVKSENQRKRSLNSFKISCLVLTIFLTF